MEGRIKHKFALFATSLLVALLCNSCPRAEALTLTHEITRQELAQSDLSYMILPDRHPAGTAGDDDHQNLLAEVGHGRKEYKIMLT